MRGEWTEKIPFFTTCASTHLSGEKKSSEEGAVPHAHYDDDDDDDDDYCSMRVCNVHITRTVYYYYYVYCNVRGSRGEKRSAGSGDKTEWEIIIIKKSLKKSHLTPLPPPAPGTSSTCTHTYTYPYIPIVTSLAY